MPCGFARFTTDGRICVSNNAAERALRGIALGRRSWTFAGSERGADRCAFMPTMIATAKLNDIDPQAWLADVLDRIADMPLSRLPELLAWNWSTTDMLHKLALFRIWCRFSKSIAKTYQELKPAVATLAVALVVPTFLFHYVVLS